MNSSNSQMPETPSDERGAWFMQALRGDSDAATRLYDACVPLIRSWLSSRVAEDIAAECAHEAMVRAFRHGRRFEPGQTFLAWLRTIAWHLALKEVRNTNRRRSRETAYHAESRLHSPSDHAADGRLVAALTHRVSALPPDQQDLIQRRFHLRHSHGEIAASLGRTRVAVSVSLHRICKRLRSDLEQHTSL
jgi:RNA polymerase sigma-70 factor (ECF subfamily)